MERTEWFPGDVKPLRKGWYELNFSHWLDNCYWTGKNWSWGPGTYLLFNQHREWRGITEPQND